VASTSILVDVVLNDAEKCEVACHDHNGDEPGDGRDHGCHNGTAEACAESKEEGDECEATCDGVEDHDSSQGLRGIGRGSVEVRVVDFGHDISRIVADMLASAVVLIGLYWSYIENAVSKCAKCDRRVSNISLVGEHHLQHRNVVDDRCRDRGDEKKNRSCEDKERANMMEHSCFCHFVGLLVFARLCLL